MTAAVLTLLTVLAALAFVVGGWRRTHHEVVRTERGYLSGTDAPLDVVCDGNDRKTFNGDVVTVEVCRCGSARPLGAPRWVPRVHRMSR